MEDKKTDQDRKDKRFYSGIASHFHFLKDGWLNHVMHSSTSYSDSKALEMLQQVREITLGLLPELAEVVA